MRLNEILLNKCEEFFELILNESQEENLSEAIHSLQEFLERDVDGWTEHTDETLAYMARQRLMEVWGLISRAEKQANPDLRESYDLIIHAMERAMNSKAPEEAEYGEGLFDLEDREPHVTDSQSFMYSEDES